MPCSRLLLRRATCALTLGLGTLLSLPGLVLAQGEGARVYLLAPKDINALSLTYMDAESNFNFAQDILIEGADLRSDILALNYNRFFSLGGRLAEIWVTGIWGSIRGDVALGPEAPPNSFFEPGSSINIPKESGIADPYLAMRVGLIGSPALSPAEFVKHRPGFQMSGLVGVYLPAGDYDRDRPVNLGTNRWGYRFGLPMIVPFASPASRTALEIVPSVVFYGDNTDPFRADLREQDPLYVVESHLTRNFTPKFWAGLDLRFQYGAETTTDRVPDGNRLDSLGGGASVGYQFTPSFGGWMSYGEIFANNDGSEGDMLRFRFAYVF